MNWIRIATRIKSDPKVGRIAMDCGVPMAHAVGLVVSALMEFPEHARTGDISHVADVVLEEWAGWRGEPGRFASVFKAQFCDDTGLVRSWEKHNGAAIRKMDADLARKRARVARGSRVEVARNSPNSRAEVAEKSRGILPAVADVSSVDKTRHNEVLTTPIGAVSTGDAARRLTAAANKGISEQFGEQPVPIRWDHPGTAQTVADLEAAGVPIAEAEQWLFDIARSRAPADGRPPRTLRYYAKAVIDAWHTEQAHRDAATLPRPAGTGTVITWDDILRANAEPEALRDVA
jgi:hypothetical protein